MAYTHSHNHWLCSRRRPLGFCALLIIVEMAAAWLAGWLASCYRCFLFLLLLLCRCSLPLLSLSALWSVESQQCHLPLPPQLHHHHPCICSLWLPSFTHTVFFHSLTVSFMSRISFLESAVESAVPFPSHFFDAVNHRQA